MPKTDQWAKYDEAMAFLREQDPGSYFDEIADLMEELIARVVLAEEKPTRPSPREVALREHEVRVGKALARRMASYSTEKTGED